MNWMLTMSRPSRREPDDGFTLVEIILAMFLVVTVMAALLGVVVSSLKTIQQAKQRQVSAALATEALEELRALPYKELITSPVGGVAAGALPFVVASGSTFSFAPPADIVDTPAEILVAGRSATIVVDEASYRVMTYVTSSVKAPGSYNLTAIVEWSSTVSNGVRRAVERSTAFSPGGCLSDALHPYSGPCQAAFSGRAGSESSDVSISQLDLTDPAHPVPSAPLMSLMLPALSSNVQIEQVVYGISTLVAGGASDGMTTSGATQTSRAVGSDPTTTIEQSVSIDVNAPFGQLVSAPAGATYGNSMNSLNAAVRAGSPACAIPSALDGTTIQVATGPAAQLRPCVVTVSNGSSSTSSLAWDGASLFTASGVVGRSGAAHIVGVSNGPGVCGQAGEGCLRSVAQREIKSATFAPAAGPLGLWYLDSYRGFAASEQGDGVLSPSTARSGTLHLWNGTTYTSIDLASTSSGDWVWGDGSTSGLPAITGTDGRAYSGTLRLTAESSSTTGPTGCKAEACVTEVTDGTIKATMRVTDATGVYEVSVNLGGAAAVSSYQAAPHG